jgi:hypothetical protein
MAIAVVPAIESKRMPDKVEVDVAALSWDELRDKAFEVLKAALEDTNQACVEYVDDFLRRLCQLKKLVEVFRDPSVATFNDAAKKLHLTRNGLYFRLDMIGLTAESLRHPGLSIMEVAARSSVLPEMAGYIFAYDHPGK